MSTEQPPKKKTRPPFKPTREQREFVNRMAGTRMTVTDICLVLGVSRRTAYKYFSDELKAGSARLHALVTNKFVEAIKNGSPWAIQCALRNLERFRYDRYDKGAVPYIANNDPIDEIKITFVTPTPKPEDAVLDLTPAPYQNAQPDYSKPAIEAPRERTRAEFGAIVEAPRQQDHRPEWPSYQSQTGEPPPSAFDRGSKNGWMK